MNALNFGNYNDISMPMAAASRANEQPKSISKKKKWTFLFLGYVHHSSTPQMICKFFIIRKTTLLMTAPRMTNGPHWAALTAYLASQMDHTFMEFNEHLQFTYLSTLSHFIVR